MPSKVALITGCSSGIGFALVERLLEEDWTVIATLRNAARRREIFAEQERRFATRLHILDCDVAAARDRQTVLQYVEQHFDGKLDCLINNAGFGLFGAVADCEEEQIRLQMEVNYLGLLFLTNLFVPALIRAKGHIINISSVLGFSVIPLSGVYAASKHAVEGISEALAIELAPTGVRVTLIEPGSHKTEFGGKIIWAARFADPQSPFFPASENYRQYLTSHMKQRGAPSTNVVRAVMRALSSPNPPLRIRCGIDSHVTYWLRWLLPQRLYLWLLRTATRIAYYRGIGDGETPTA